MHGVAEPRGGRHRLMGWCAAVLGGLAGCVLVAKAAWAVEPLVILASPTVVDVVNALGRQFEQTHSGVQVQVVTDTGLGIRRMIASIEQRGRTFISTGPVHLVAPGGDELLARLEHKYYVLPGTRTAYASSPLVLVVPESLVDAPVSLMAAVQDARLRVAVADPARTSLGQATQRWLEAQGVAGSVRDRLDIAADADGVVDHLLHGQADVAIVFGADAARQRERVRVIDQETVGTQTRHSMAMERSCPNRPLCQEFLDWLREPSARAVVRDRGYGVPLGEVRNAGVR